MKYTKIITILSCFVFIFSITDKIQAKELSYQEVLREALEKNTKIASQSAKIKSQSAENLPSRLFFLPKVSISHSEYQAKAKVSGNLSKTRRAGLNADWNLFRFGADLAGWSAANASADREQSNLQKEILAAEIDASQKIFQFVQSKQEVQITKKIYESEVQSHEIARQRYEQGLLPRQEVEKIYIDLINAETRWKNAEIRAKETGVQITSLLGLDTDSIEQKWPWQEKFLTEKVYSILQREFKIENIPAWKAAEAHQKAELGKVRREFRKILPSIDLDTTYNFRNTTASADEWSSTLTISLPIFDHLVLYSRYASQVASHTIAEQDLEQNRRNAVTEWEFAKTAFQKNLSSAISHHKNLNIARRLYQDNVQRFHAGKISVNDLNDDQERLYRTEQSALESWNSAHISFVRLCHSLGESITSCEKL